MRTAVLLATVTVALLAAYPAHAGGPIKTAVYVQMGELPGNAAAETAFFGRIRETGATAVRLNVSWRDIAPKDPAPDFNAKDPADPGYTWTKADRAVTLLLANGLTPLLDVTGAPGWAGGRSVIPSALGEFATAITTRYSGTFQGLPRVRYWLVWNEPNLSIYLRPQVSGKSLVGAGRYRKMVNDFAAAAHGVHSDNIVVAGMVAPFTFRNDPGPLKFMQAVLSAKTHFDVWAVHPYTSGSPRHHAFKRTDISLGDLPRARGMLDSAVRAHHIVSSRKVGFWVTEFSWDSRPPDARGVPLNLEAQWVSEALFRAWQAGVGMFTWFALRDEAHPSPFQSGLFFKNWKPKPALTAFRFPFVALRRSKSVYVWGRTPAGAPMTAIIERKAGKSWRRVASVATNGAGVFSRTLSLRLPRSTSMRARIAGSASLAFPLKLPPDRFVNPFGS